MRSEVSTIAYLPIIPAPAHEMVTVMTVLLRCKDIATKLSQSKTVVTFDQTLYYQARELVWLFPDKLDGIVLRLGGFHIAMNFLGVLGQHFADSGVTDLWIDTGIFNECTANQMMQGKFWNRAIRGHKLMHEALSRLLLEKFRQWQKDEQEDTHDEVSTFAQTVAEAFQMKSCNDTSIQCLEELMSNMQEFERDFVNFIYLHNDNATFIIIFFISTKDSTIH